ncbi:alpha/beta hydrolase [Pseudomonas sp.]|jgi:poly(3-hydroxybutyrate) depolymerase|uniref:alpha/beta hydrolase n=1 Tax=Pseudomonas sp. TaxID=306 RepID=UPI0037C8CEDB
MRLMPALWLAIATVLGACASTPNPEVRQALATALASKQHWQSLALQTEVFRVQAYVPPTFNGEALTVYLEGDGFAWRTSRQPSADPTPLDPLALRLALAQPDGNAAYLGRPCQYLDAQQAPCATRYWGEARFAENVVRSLDQAVGQLKFRAGAQRVVLVGYSGGGALAMLLAARRSDVQRVVTVAGNLDHTAWTRHHRVTPLHGSLNPSSLRSGLAQVEQVHLVGEQDRIITPQLVEAFVAGYTAGHRAQVRVLSGYDHHCCWAKDWSKIWSQQLPHN